MLELEDEGMSQLLMLNDLICKVINTRVSADLPVGVSGDVMTHATSSPSPSTVIADHIPQPHPHSNSTIIHPHLHSNTHANTTAQSVEELRKAYEELGEKLRRCEVTATSPATTYNYQGESMSHSMPQVTSTQVTQNGSPKGPLLFPVQRI